jgi:uncharacterized membrane protein YeaQ/YmgE (transglycosylase-associated protein family)
MISPHRSFGTSALLRRVCNLPVAALLDVARECSSRSRGTKLRRNGAVSRTAPIRRWEVVVGIIAWIVLGAIAGFITNLIMGGKEGVIATIILGIVGAVVGGYIAGTVLKVADVTGVNVESIIVAVIGAVIVVALYRMVTGRRTAA